MSPVQVLLLLAGFTLLLFGADAVVRWVEDLLYRRSMRRLWPDLTDNEVRLHGSAWEEGS